MTARQERGLRNYLAGGAAEQSVLRRYRDAGCALLAQRWRGQAGEIDLILQREDEVIFVEVKTARTFDTALTYLVPRQVARLLAAGAEFLGTQPMGLLTPARFDVAVVNAAGDVSVLENALVA
jgi:putative endonuclease